MSQPIVELGPELNKDLAESINRLFTNKQSKESFEKYKNEFKIPVNCKQMTVQKVNSEIWPLLPTSIRQADYNAQHQQQQLSMVSSAVAQIAEKLFMSKVITTTDRQTMLKMSLEATAILGSLTQDINMNRRQKIKPSLNSEFSGICNQTQTGEWLFGDNIAEQLKATKASSSLVKSSVVRSSFRGPRFTPYNAYRSNLNWRSPSPQVRGGTQFRGSRGNFNRTSRPFQRPFSKPQFNRRQ
jgi:hypothetical protein